MNIDYSIVIPIFNRAKELRALLEDIFETCKRYRPRVIIVSDDGSTDDDTKYVPKIYDSSIFPIKLIENEEHKGPFYAEKAGLDAVETEFAIVLHSDLRLRGEPPPVEDLYSDTLSVLACYLAKTPDASAVSAYSLAFENSRKIQGGPRSLGVDRLPYSYYKMYNFAPLSRFQKWRREFSADSYIYALRMQSWRESGGFDETFAPYLYYHDDFFARARKRGYHVYFTKDVIVYHPARFQNKPQGSLSIVNPELYQSCAKAFKSRWQNDPSWQRGALENEAKIIEWIGGP